MRTNSELLNQTNELAQRFAAMNGLYIKTPNPDFRNINTPECQKFWSMACLAQEMLTGANPNICNNLRAVTEVIGDDADIKREFERIEQRAKRKEVWDGRVIKTNSCDSKAQTKSPSAGTDGL